MPRAKPNPLSRPLARYGVAFTAVSVAVMVRLLMMGIEPLRVVPDRSPYLLLFAAVIIASAYGGFGPGISATLLAVLASDVFLIAEPAPKLPGIADPVQLAVFLGEGITLSFVGAMLHRARRRAEEADLAARRLEQKILEISEGERRRVGHDLHDGLGQHLTGIALLAKALKQRLSSLRLPESRQADKITELVNESIGWTRDLARGLSPVSLESGGLARALEELASNASNLLGISCTCRCDTLEVQLDGEKSLHLYRIAQEAINNSVKHGKARTVEIGLTAHNGQITMTVSDDGSGISEKTRLHPGVGLQIMQYRARMIGATLSVDSAHTRGGTIVTCSVPSASSEEVS